MVAMEEHDRIIRQAEVVQLVQNSTHLDGMPRHGVETATATAQLVTRGTSNVKK